MRTINLPEMTYMNVKELKAQRDALNRQIEEAIAASKNSLWEQINLLLDENEVTPAELVKHYAGSSIATSISNVSKKRDKVPAKYQSLDGTQTYSGRGQLPRWMRDAIELNPKLTKESFLIK